MVMAAVVIVVVGLMVMGASLPANHDIKRNTDPRSVLCSRTRSLTRIPPTEIRVVSPLLFEQFFTPEIGLLFIFSIE